MVRIFTRSGPVVEVIGADEFVECGPVCRVAGRSGLVPAWWPDAATALCDFAVRERGQPAIGVD
eukprot:6336388-Heterocapsa_arctica.AAC.1